MEIQASPSPSPSPQVAAARKLWNVVRIVFLILRKGIAKSKHAVDFNFNSGKLAAAKAILHLQRHHHDAVHPHRDYEFSCSNSPAASFPFHVIKRGKHRTRFPRYDDVSSVQKVLEIFNSNNQMEGSPLVKSSIGKKVRITDSPFPLKEEEEDNQVDVAAEEFIKRFYKDLHLQQKMAAIESPYHSNFWGR
ncbi:hypothetical protein VNO80_12310 [Phaseolus coccineus]|uniref:Avr9/Cf-9 rapidly elicited protein n=1 Tax=Phaseolus coccineus TaxID=3886 RepID=A0AAN9N660_PHACN